MPHFTQGAAPVSYTHLFVRKPQGATLAERMEADLADDNVVSQKGLVEMFDSTIGASTVLLPFGGRTQGSETQVSVQKLPVEGYTEDVYKRQPWRR